MAKAASLAVGLALAGCAPGVAQSSAAPKPVNVDRIAVRSSSFWLSATTGSPFKSEWQIDSEGELVFRSIETRRDERNLFHHDDVTRRFSAGRSGFAKIEALLRPLERYAGGKVPCDAISYSDSLVGAVSWTRRGMTREVAFDQGCPTEAAKNVYDRFDKAEALASKWGAKGKVVRSVPMAQPFDRSNAQ